ncbi:mesothelin-like protein [Alosa alosa]|uniref:mesothelin-like protein n=1 Tax=Alosa alosa TaxID=278164 RepID=UPI0020151837|nr:mesothelin-like protein [Alosa alosa]
MVVMCSRSNVLIHLFLPHVSRTTPCYKCPPPSAGTWRPSPSAGISTLGNSSVGFSTGQLSTANPSVIVSSLSVVSTVVGWNQGQAMTLIQKLLSSGRFKITNSKDLWSLGTLITGVPSATINSISASEILTATQSPTLVNNLMTAPTIIQQTFVSKIISVSSTSSSIITNVPNALATQIPRNFLQDFTQTTEVVTTLNQKTWTQSQSVLIFDTVATAVENANDISFQVLQGFTCTRVQTLTKVKIKSLIRGCRRRNKLKLKLQQTQLTCMYYQLRGESDAADYSLYPADMLLYYDYSTVKNCKNYFTELGFADFTVLTGAYESYQTTLVNNAKTCLGITGFNISAANINILGNMVCLLTGSYVENSDPSILEKLKNCDDLSTSQVTGMETLLLSGKTKYGVPSTWTRETPWDLDPLPLYFTSNLWKEMNRREARRFIKTFIKQLRRQGVPRRKIQYIKREFQQAHRAKRDTAIECTVGAITQIQINDDAFPIDYDATQFNACLSLTVLKDNLPEITDKIDQDDYRQVILEKLNQAYPDGLSDDVVQMLGPVSRRATTDDISKWNITKIDTLSSLMKTSDGDWSENQTKAIMTKYFAASNSIDSSVLNSLGGSGVCSLGSGVLETITSSSLQQADALPVSSCSLDKKKVLFPIAQAAFINQTSTTKRSTTTVTLTQYQLIQSYLGGATESFVRTLASSSVNMDIDTFLGLDQSVIQTLSVSDVKSLLGDTNVNELRTYSSNAIVQDWISRQFQTDLDTLGLGLTGGRATPATTTNVNGNAGSATNAAATTTTATTAAGATTANTTASGGASIRPASGLYCLLLATVVSALYRLQ